MSKLSLVSVSALMILSVVGCAAQTSDDDADEASDTQALLAGTHYSGEEVADFLRNAGFPDSEIGPMVCTAKYESAWYERASNHNSNGTVDYGLFQINSTHFKAKGCPSTATGMYDAQKNTDCAYEVWKSQGRNAWYGYQKHKTTCEHYAAP